MCADCRDGSVDGVELVVGVVMWWALGKVWGGARRGIDDV